MNPTRPRGSSERGPARRHRAALAVAAALLSPLLLTGCDRSEVALEINGDGTVDGSAYLAILSTYPDLGQLVRSSSGVGALDPFDALPDSEIEPYRSSGYIGEQVTFEGASWRAAEEALSRALSAPQVDPALDADTAAPGAQFRIEELSGGNGEPQLKLTGTNPTLDEFVGFITDFAATAAAGATPNLAPPQMALVITFPGRVLTTNGDQTGLDDNTVSWSFEQYQQLDGNIEAIAENPPVTGPGFREQVRLHTLDVLAWSRAHLPAVTFLALALLAVVLYLRSSRRPAGRAVTASQAPVHDPHDLLITDEEFRRPQLVLIGGSPVAFDEPQPDDFLAPVPTEPTLALAPALPAGLAAGLTAGPLAADDIADATGPDPTGADEKR